MSPVPKEIAVDQETWDTLTDVEKTFLKEADAGGLRYLVENGIPYAWGPAHAGLFSMDIEAEPHSIDGFLITIREES